MTLVLSGCLFPQNAPRAHVPARLAVYYGYPSLINGSLGDVEKAASVLSEYDVVVLGDGLEFPDRQSGRYPEGDPEEHQKALQIIAAVQRRSPGTRFYGYICLGEILLPGQKELVLTQPEMEQRIRLWKDMGVKGIFLDEAGYDYAAITRKRQNMAVSLIHKEGLSAFMNAYFLDHLFSAEDTLPFAKGKGKNPERLPPLLDRRDLFLLESFQIKNGAYEEAAAWQARLAQAIKYRRRFGSAIFATTTTREQEPLASEKFNYVWWAAQLYGIDGVGWGEPSFAAATNFLPDRRCRLDHKTLDALQPASTVSSDSGHFWRKEGSFLVVLDSRTHSVRRLPVTGARESTDIDALLHSSQAEPLFCGGKP